MQAGVVEPAEVLDDGELKLRSRLPDAITDELGLERVDEAFGQRIVKRVADRADRLQHLVIIQDLPEFGRGVLGGFNWSSQHP